MGTGCLQDGIWSQMGPPVIRLPPQGDKSSLGAAVHPDGWIVAQIWGGGGWQHLGAWAQGGQHRTSGNLLETGSCSAPSRPDTPKGVPAAQLVPRWHVTNGDTLLLACFVRSGGRIEARAEGTAKIHMSAERADLSKVIFGAGICASFCNNGVHCCFHACCSFH